MNALKTTFIPFHDWKGVGGPYTFMGNLTRELETRGIELCPTFHDCKQMLFPIRYDLDKLHWGRVRGKKYIVRLDGIWYPQKHDDWRKQNQPVKDIYRHYADHVVFQSEYSRRQCFEMFGELPQDRYSIIVNGADPQIFFPAESKDGNQDTLRLITTGNFRNAAMIEPLVVALDQVKLDRPFTLTVVGPVADELRRFLDRSYVNAIGTKTVQETAELLRQSDLFLYSHLNPPCPNSVIEAVSCGLPIVGFDSGAMNELVPWSPELLAKVNDETFQSYEDFDAQGLKDCLEHAVANLETYREKALEKATSYPFDQCAERYLDVLDRAAKLPASNANTKLGRSIQSLPGRAITKVVKKAKLDEKLRSTVVELLAGVPRAEFLQFMLRAIDRRTSHLPPSESLRTLFALDKAIYEREGALAVAYDDGVHTKHRHMQYHSFFKANVASTDHVLDLGCGKGELANSLADVVTEGRVFGLDRRESSITFARANFGHRDNLTFVLGDITDRLPTDRFDVVVMSNVLEHIELRISLLQDLKRLFAPRRILVRVPMYQRDWRVPLQDELGFDYRLDPEHFIEFTPESLCEEVSAAGFAVASQEIRWGEIWAVIEPADQSPS